jgi:hypothetical protein
MHPLAYYNILTYLSEYKIQNYSWYPEWTPQIEIRYPRLEGGIQNFKGRKKRQKKKPCTTLLPSLTRSAITVYRPMITVNEPPWHFLVSGSAA